MADILNQLLNEEISLPVGGTDVLALGTGSPGFGIDIYNFSSTTGWGTKYPAAATPIPDTANGIDFSPSGDAIAIAHSTFPFASAYSWSSTGFGTKFSDPIAKPPRRGRDVKFSPAGTEVIFASEANWPDPFVHAYPWSASGFGTRFSNPLTFPVGRCTGISFHPSGNAVAFALPGATPVAVYGWSSTGFGTKFSDPAIMPAGSGIDVAFSPSGNYLAVGNEASAGEPQRATIYPWSALGFGARYSFHTNYTAGAGWNPGTRTGVVFHPDETAIFFSHDNSPGFHAFEWSAAGFGNKYPNPVGFLTGSGTRIDVSKDGKAVAISHTSLENGAYANAFEWVSGSGWGNRFSNPSVLPSGATYCVRFSKY